MLCVLVFLSLQLLGAGSHQHAYTEQQNDCAACVIGHMPSDIPPPALALLPLTLLVSLALPILQPTVRVQRTAYFTPPAHAPPGVAMIS
ncbi:hypothetical protein GTP23_10210 [Pseudoduganella sp. FT93W]|uniref:DUF2946 domain-containing protein n=2 Tax=Duganella fentianensis TaxID=2692177 RepID=A0A845HX22_9BURK|nr:hypothetical protein [Duganella fentianensis]